MTSKVGWGILGTARISETAFLPALRVADGRALAVGGRDLARTRDYAARNGVERALPGYQDVLDDPDVQAVYVPLPNSLHGEWTIKALKAGKAVLCEKPLCGSIDEARRVLEVAKTSAKPLWEAFVFPFLPQHAKISDLISSGAIGPPVEIHSEFHFRLRSTSNIRLSSELGGGSLGDVGCYPIRFAQLVFGCAPVSAVATAEWTPGGVDLSTRGVLDFGDGRNLLLSCGMDRDSGTFSRIVGEDGEIRISNPFHAREHDVVEVKNQSDAAIYHLGREEPTFSAALRHIHAVLDGTEAPRHTAVDDSLATEVALDLLARSARSGRVERFEA